MSETICPYLAVVFVDVAATRRVKVIQVLFPRRVIHIPEVNRPIVVVGRARMIHDSTKDMKLLRYIFFT